MEEWEKLKSEADMEFYDWQKSSSKKSLEMLFQKGSNEIENNEVYSDAIGKLMNEGESQCTVNNYALAVRTLLNVPQIKNDSV